MKMTHTIISGSWVLYVIFPGTFTPGDLDLYTAGQDIRRVNLLIRFLISRGYQIVSVADEIYMDGFDAEAADIDRIIKLSTPHSNGTRNNINVITTRSENEIRPIFHFHSTLVMNFIAWYGMVCLYPVLTLNRRGLVNDPNPSPRIHAFLNKYRARGFDLQTGLELWFDRGSHVCGHSSECPETIGFLFSDSVLFVPFEEGRSLAEFIDNDRWILRVSCNYFRR
jgi:hypothetical protein